MPTATTSSATRVTTLADLYEKRNTDVKTSIKLVTEEAKWFRSYPKENIVVSGNENRVPLILTQPIHPAVIPDGGNERIMSSPAPTHGTFMPSQVNVRYGFTGLAQALTNRAKAAMIEDQTEYQAQMAGYSIGRHLGLSTYGTTVGTIAVVKTTGSAGTTQNGLAVKNAYGSAVFVPGGDLGVQDKYLSQLFRVGDVVAIVRSAALIEFGTVTASPSTGSGVGFIDVVFQSSITPTVGDLLVFANADGDNTITGTDYNNWPYGFTDILTGAPMGVSNVTYPAWVCGSVQTASQRLGFSVKERMINECWNAGGVRINKFIVGQNTRRDSITGQLGGRRYDGPETDIEGDLNAGKGQEYFTSQLSFPNVMIGWYDKALSKIELSDQPDDGASKSIFKLDKVQGKSQIAAAYDYFYAKIPSSLAATGYAANLQGA